MGIGTIIVVQPGEKVPIDGTVVQGESTLNTAALTGESLPREVKTGDEIISGCINMTGLLHIQTTKEFGESTVSKILDLVENASSRKSKSEDFISRFAKIYTPAVCYAALALAVLPAAGADVCIGSSSWLGNLGIPGTDLPCCQLPMRFGSFPFLCPSLQGLAEPVRLVCWSKVLTTLRPCHGLRL